MSVIEAGLWVLVVGGSLLFLAVKLRNWEPLDKMPQDDFAMLYTAATVAQVEPRLLYQPERWNALTGLDLHLPGPFPYAPTIAMFMSPSQVSPTRRRGSCGWRWTWRWWRRS
jgi:hypothetical protein